MYRKREVAKVGERRPEPAPLSNVNRGSLPGFKRYFSQRQYHFKELFGYDYYPEIVEIVFNSVLNSNDRSS